MSQRSNVSKPKPGPDPAPGPVGNPGPVGPPAATAPTHLAGCDEELPLLPITRQFDFGQFVFLHTAPEPATTPEATPGPASSTPIVIDPTGDRYQLYKEWLDRYQKLEYKIPPSDDPRFPPAPGGDPLGGISLSRVLSKTTADPETPVELEVTGEALSKLLDTGEVVINRRHYSVDLDSDVAQALRGAKPTLVTLSLGAGTFMTRIVPVLKERALTDADVDSLLANGTLGSNGDAERLNLDASGIRSLLEGEPAVVRTASSGGDSTWTRLLPPQAPLRPAAPSVHVADLGAFLASPSVPAVDGTSIALKLDSGEVRQLRARGEVTVTAGSTPVTVLHAAPRTNGDTAKISADYAVTTAESAMTATSTVTPIGIPVAVFLPWRQTWTLTGFSRGELRHSLALAPQEETFIEVVSWQRRERSLDQSSQTDVEQSFESVRTERETEDVFQELTNRHDFAWQIEGSVDATYNAGTGSITASAGGGLSDAVQLQQIARTTQQRLQESTMKAAAKVRAVRSTRITDTVESGSSERVTRRITNPNYSRTLTLDFFETLVHYEVRLAPQPDRLGLVALLQNPMAKTEFTRALIRRNETALRRALLEPALADGFDASRMVEAYDRAKRLLEDQALAEKKNQGTTQNDRTEPAPSTGGNSGPSPQETAVVSLLRQINSAAALTRAGTNVPAMTAINDGRPVTASDRRSSQYWLFRRMAAKYLPSLLDAIDKVSASPTIADAGAVLAVMPGPGAATTLANLNDKSDVEKEQSGLGPEIARIIGGLFKWAWSTGRCREEALYTVNDAGLAGLVDSLQQAWKAYEAKKAEGDMQTATEVLVTRAAAEQEKLSSEDKLAMAFPLDELSAAYEREDALRAHLNDHLDHYSFALFQALSPAEQTAYIERASGGSLQVGMFEPRVVAINGPQLAVPLLPPPEGELRTFLENLRTSFAAAFSDTADQPDNFIFPTAGLTINARLGGCSTCEDYIEDSRTAELRRLVADAEAAELRALRLRERIKAGQLDDPEVTLAPLQIQVDK